MYHLTLIGGVLVPLRVSDGRFWWGALLLETKVFHHICSLFVLILTIFVILNCRIANKVINLSSFK